MDDDDLFREALRFKDSEILLASEAIPEGALVARPIIGYLGCVDNQGSQMRVEARYTNER